MKLFTQEGESHIAFTPVEAYPLFIDPEDANPTLPTITISLETAGQVIKKAVDLRLSPLDAKFLRTRNSIVDPKTMALQEAPEMRTRFSDQELKFLEVYAFEKEYREKSISMVEQKRALAEASLDGVRTVLLVTEAFRMESVFASSSSASTYAALLQEAKATLTESQQERHALEETGFAIIAIKQAAGLLPKEINPDDPGDFSPDDYLRITHVQNRLWNRS